MKKKETYNIILGIFLLLGMHSAVFIVLKILASILFRFNITLATYVILPFLNLGVLQLVYVIPAVFWLRQKKQFGRRKGVIIGAVITALINLVFLALLLYSRA